MRDFFDWWETRGWWFARRHELSEEMSIGIWDEVREDAKGFWIKGRLLPEVEKARKEANHVLKSLFMGTAKETKE